MLDKIFKAAAVSAAMLTAMAGSTAAENYRVLMMDYAFFPEISYVRDGDTLTFVNMSGLTRTIEAANSSWSLPALSEGDEATITVVEGMADEFIIQVDESTPEPIIGKLNFSAPPMRVSN